MCILVTFIAPIKSNILSYFAEKSNFIGPNKVYKIQQFKTLLSFTNILLFNHELVPLFGSSCYFFQEKKISHFTRECISTELSGQLMDMGGHLDQNLIAEIYILQIINVLNGLVWWDKPKNTILSSSASCWSRFSFKIEKTNGTFLDQKWGAILALRCILS